MQPRALVVDDNPVNLELIAVLLEAEGFDVTSVRDAEEALASLQAEGTPDIFVLDVQLPGMSGLDLLRRLRSHSRTSTVCAVIVTSYAMETDRQMAEAAGCDSYFTKPIDTRQFASQVREVYEQKKARCDAAAG